MSAMTFTLCAANPGRLDLGPLTPNLLSGLKSRDIARLEIAGPLGPIAVGDLFTVAGSDPRELRFEAGSPLFDRVGQRMTEGAIHIEGDVGVELGRRMTGGAITVTGHADAFVGSQMSGGTIRVAGNAGESLGGPLIGEIAGMRGGVIVVGGKTGSLAGERMRRGMIVVNGAGDYAGCGMIAGTLVVLGRSGHLPGYLMRRGTIVLARGAETTSPSFVDCGAHELAFAALLGNALARLGMKSGKLLKQPLRRLAGDLAVLGKGEILMAQS